jgi:glucoside 3-dehydrogenase (cytochrome c) catalytic subunit
VTQLEVDSDSGKVSRVLVTDSRTGQRQAYTAKLVFLCASTVASTQLMLNSTSEKFPNGLANRSGTLGHYLMDHPLGMGAAGVFLDNMDSYYFGHRPNGLYIPRFRNVGKQDSDLDFIRGYGYQTETFRRDWTMMFNSKGFGADLKHSLRKPGMWFWFMGTFAECLPRETNRLYLSKNKVDRFGVPQVVFDMEWSDNERALWQDGIQQAQRIMKAAGAVFIIPGDGEMSVPGTGIHEMGTARMGHDPGESVLNGFNQAHDVPNLFVTDGSFMTSASCVNPSLTYMAFTARACDYAATRLSEGAI